MKGEIIGQLQESWIETTVIKPGATGVTQELKREISGEIQDHCGLKLGRRKSLRWVLIIGPEFLSVYRRSFNQISR